MPPRCDQTQHQTGMGRIRTLQFLHTISASISAVLLDGGISPRFAEDQFSVCDLNSIHKFAAAEDGVDRGQLY